MKEMVFAYRPIEFTGIEGTDNRVTPEQFARKMELEGTASFIKANVIVPFEESFKDKSIEKLCCGDFDIERNSAPSKPSISWKSVYEGLKSFLNVRADDSRAQSHDDVRFIEGVGYCIEAGALERQIEKLMEESTSEPSDSGSIRWPTKKREEDLPQRIQVPRRDYYKVNQENGITVLKAKRFVSGIKEYVLTPFEEELKRWFEVNTGYCVPDSIPDKEAGHVERVLELAPGSYIQVQLVRKEDPKYKEVIDKVNEALADVREDRPVQLFKRTIQGRTNYVNIKSLNDFMTPDSLATNDLIKVGHRYVITP